jgi:hypothetical protein
MRSDKCAHCCANLQDLTQPALHITPHRLGVGMRIICTLGIAAIIAFGSLSGCATTKIQAPFDSFVCYSSSLANCLSAVQNGQLQGYVGAIRNHQKAGPIVGASPFLFDDPDANKTPLSTTDGKYECDYGSVGYAQAIDPTKEAEAVFVSPTILRLLAEEHVRLIHSRKSCERLVQEYNYQIVVVGLQDHLSVDQGAYADFNGAIDKERETNASVGARQLTAPELAKSGLSAGTTLRDGVLLLRQDMTSTSVSLRNDYKAQVVTVDFARRFDDANLAIDLQLREIARTLFLLDRSVPIQLPGHLLPGDYPNQSWIKQGTDTLRVNR